jgi:hypothetical protein
MVSFVPHTLWAVFSDTLLPVVQSCVDSFVLCAVPPHWQHVFGFSLFDMNAQYAPIVSVDRICLISEFVKSLFHYQHSTNITAFRHHL